MKFILSLIIIFILVILQSCLYPYLEIKDAFPNLILIIVLILSILRPYKKNLVWIIAGGFFLDIFSFNNPIGISILGLLLIGYLANFLSHTIFKKPSIFSAILIGIGGILIYRFILILTLLITGTSFQLSFSRIIFQFIYNLIILAPLFYLVKRFKKNV